MNWDKTKLGLSILFIITFIILAGVSIIWGYFYTQYQYEAVVAARIHFTSSMVNYQDSKKR